MRARLFWMAMSLQALAACTAHDQRAGGAEPKPAATSEPTAWHTLGAWSDRGNRQTESFDVTTGALRLTWTTKRQGTEEATSFRVALHSSISGRPLETLVDTTGAGSGSVRIAVEPHVAYLMIDSNGLAWDVTLEEALPRPAGGGASR